MPLHNQEQVNNQATQCPEGCCQGDELLCLSIPCPVSLVLLGLELQLELPCLRLTAPGDLTPEQSQQVSDFLSNLIQNLSTSITTP